MIIPIDGIRPQLYDDAALAGVQDSFFAMMRERMTESARARGHVVLDLQPSFRARHRRDGTRFDVDIDAHWNAAGHAVAAEAIASSAPFAAVFGGEER